MPMTKHAHPHSRSSLAVALALLLGTIIWLPLAGGAGPAAAEQARPSVTLPLIDPERGRRLFTNEGCVICHSVNGVGGTAAPALDATVSPPEIDILDFVARMWRGAAAMIELQALELGYQIDLTPDEIADLAGFAGDPRAQAKLSIEDIPGPLRNWLLDEPYWDEEEWPQDDLPEEFPELGDGEDL